VRNGYLKPAAAIAGVSAVLGALSFARPATAGPGLVVGAVADSVRSSTLVDAEAKMETFRLAGFRAVRITSYWHPGETAPDAGELTVIQNVATAASMNGVRVFVTVMSPGSATTPLTDDARAGFASYASAVVRGAPSIHDLIIGNEPNLNRFWLPQFNPDGSDAAASSYIALLAQTYDTVKAVAPDVTVYGGAVSPRGSDNPNGVRPTHSPTAFIRDLGAAYRASGRDRPVMDAFAIHVYEDNSSISPTFAHPNGTTIAIADYDKLVTTLGEAFDGTAQPGSTLPILYGEFGVEAQIPASKAGLYSGTELPATKPVPESTQAEYYAQALALAFCQPTVAGLLIFQAQDQPELANWQSGVFYADGTPKSSLPQVRAALNRAAGGSIARCPGLQLVVHTTYLRFGTRTAARKGLFRATLSCDLDCLYEVRVVKLPGGVTKLARRGRADAGELVHVTFLPHHLGPGTYRYSLRLVHPVNPAPPTLREGQPFVLP
jgi:hypothetical protein